MTLLCSEMSPSEGKDGSVGEVWRHCNLRMSYMKQDHLKALGPYFDTSPFVYITSRFQHGYDEELQRRLCEPEDEEEAQRRKALAKEVIACDERIAAKAAGLDQRPLTRREVVKHC